MLAQYIYDYVIMHECQCTTENTRLIRAIDEIIQDKKDRHEVCDDKTIFLFAILVVVAEVPDFSFGEWKDIYVRLDNWDVNIDNPNVRLREVMKETYPDYFTRMMVERTPSIQDQEIPNEWVAKPNDPKDQRKD